MTIDNETGLPELPEGYFWRVKETYKGSTYLRVEIRKRGLIGSRRIEWHPVEKSRASDFEIKRAAEYALVWKNQGGFDSSGDRWKKFVGNYPPKKLEP